VRGQARVRARVAPKSPRAKSERSDRRKPRSRKTSDDSSDTGDAEPVAAGQGATLAPTTRPEAEDRQSRAASGSRRTSEATVEEVGMEEVRASVEQFLEGLATAFGLDTPVELEVTEDQALEASIVGKHGILLGPKGRTLEAIQELTRVAAQRNAPSSVRIRVDVGGYREARRVALVDFARAAADRALGEDVEIVLEPMNAADRKVIHDSLAEVVGISTRSAGNEPRRRVIVVPDSPQGESGGHAEEDDSTD
jgi:spoIIIJ-associated protein